MSLLLQAGRPGRAVPIILSPAEPCERMRPNAGHGPCLPGSASPDHLGGEHYLGRYALDAAGAVLDVRTICGVIGSDRPVKLASRPVCA